MRTPSLMAAVLLFCFTAVAAAQTTIVSTQLRPIEEAEKMRNVLLKGAADPVNFIPEDSNTYQTRMQAELAAAKGRVHVTIALEGELAPLDAMGGLTDVSDVIRQLSASRDFSAGSLELAKMGGKAFRFVPFLTNTYIMAANKKALNYLPKGADLDRLTWEQVIEWSKNLKQATGAAKFGLPAGPKGLLHRFFQGYLYPDYTGGLVRTFKTGDAEKMWADLRELWQYTNPRSTAYNFMEEPLKTGEVWVAFDHTARLLPALTEKPGDFVAFPAPAGPKGRYYMPVLAGLAIPKNTPDRSAAVRLIDHLTKPKIQALALQEVGFFPAVKADVGKLPQGTRIAAEGVLKTFGAKDGKAAKLPVGLGARNGEFNKVFIDTFQRIIIRNENIRTVLNEQARVLSEVIKAANAPCWAPDESSGTQPCPVL